ncbi:SAC3 family protein C isoform X2 [Vigna unguiculata]|uniref:SAC3 family protein C isoform X2 n=1 Tax=Vigna unguiculata TaxID=3917 RepID=UPI001016B3FF|nr:SAC3 family protein C isoform X2 [Vigna unguiculata]
MEGGNGNRGSSFSQSRRSRGRGRGHRFPSNQSKVSNFGGRGTSSSTSGNTASNSVLSNRQEEDAQPSSNIVGTCPYMCPERERIQREKLRDLAGFERLNGNPRKSSPALAVKKFCRTISTKYVEASDLRPIAVLEDTLNYLWSLLESKEHSFEEVHDFMFDRTRSLRQDITMQNIVNHKAIYLYERMGEPLSVWFRRVSTPVLKSKEMCFARRILRSSQLGNYKDFFCTAAAQATYLQFCIMMPYINEVRALALSCINFGGYKLHPYPLVDLSKHLMIKESDLESFCHYCGLEICTDESGNKLLPTKQTTFSHPKGRFQSYSFLGLQEYESQF